VCIGEVQESPHLLPQRKAETVLFRVEQVQEICSQVGTLPRLQFLDDTITSLNVSDEDLVLLENDTELPPIPNREPHLKVSCHKKDIWATTSHSCDHLNTAEPKKKS
ncbi:hypothetical protein TNCV_3687951, partial [Trichonephila clavipes]